MVQSYCLVKTWINNIFLNSKSHIEIKKENFPKCKSSQIAFDRIDIERINFFPSEVL